ncbi:gustatory and pheromone receptor 39a isoform X3 [Drosophila takahashii]|uniref:gustatory and pheromone receptor 39a isoform X3 n=1 Tax=Drosophila takahashii TaxID=29030 RepID=UPI001CF8EA30|nr:gustatory and pheromone receptor 39a isoform X1 [Drosophila takahashii]
MGRMNLKLLSFLHHQRYLGLSDLDFSESQQNYGLHATWISISTQVLVTGVFVSSLVAALAQSLSYMDTKSQTGDTYDNAVIVTCSVSQLIANLWFRSQQGSQESLLKRISQLQRRLQCETLELTKPRWLYRIWLGVCLLYMTMVAHFSIHWLTNMQLSQIVTLLGFVARCILANFLFTCYAGMVLSLQRLLRAQVEQLEHLVSTNSISMADLASCLRAHDEILLLGQRELIAVYGGVLLFLFMYQVMQCVLIVYVSNSEGFQSARDLVLILIWLTPMLFYLILPLIVNDVLNQANKTAKILAKVPRTGTGLDRMIEKFLLKNLRQQPILTAYGFFALDKSTLFKLFTAIFTYMVILVQFKEMENSTKTINKF